MPWRGYYENNVITLKTNTVRLQLLVYNKGSSDTEIFRKLLVIFRNFFNEINFKEQKLQEFIAK